MNKFFQAIIKESNLLIIVPAVTISLILIGFLVYGLSTPASTDVVDLSAYTDIQNQFEITLLTEFDEGDYNESAPFFKLNPFKISPLSGIIMFTTEQYNDFRVVVKGKTEEADIEFITYEKKLHLIPVYGLYPNWTNTIELYDYVDGENDILLTTITVQTEGLPDTIALPTEINTTYEYFQDDMMLVMPALGSLPTAYDFNGDVRWYLTSNFSWDPHMLENGHMLVGTNRLMSDPYYVTGLYEIDFLGKIYKEYIIPYGYHHDVDILPNGNPLVLTSDFDGTVEDIIVEIDKDTGTIINEWDLKDYLPVLDGMSEMWTTYDWFHNNSVDYDPNTNAIILSGRHQDAVISIDYSSNTLNWVLGDPNNWGSDFVDQYFFTPIGSDFEWQYAQHSAFVLENGDIFLFDNGNNKSKFTESYVDANDSYSRGVIYSLDTNNMTIEQIYQYGKERGSSFYSPYISNVEYYADGHYMIHSGGHGTLNEDVLNVPALLSDDPDNAVLKSFTVEVQDDVEMYYLELPGNYYRAARVNLYDGIGYLPGKAKVLGSQVETAIYNGEIELSFNLFDTVPSRFHLEMIKENDRLVVDGTFEKDDLIFIVLENAEETLQYFVPTSSTAYTAMCITINDQDERVVTYYINEQNVTGRFHIYLIVNGHRYDTYQDVDFQ